MTADELDCRFEWIEAAIRWHRKQVAVHQDAEIELCRIHTELCRAPRRTTSADALTAGGPASDTPGRFLPDLAGAVMAPVISPWERS